MFDTWQQLLGPLVRDFDLLMNLGNFQFVFSLSLSLSLSLSPDFVNQLYKPGANPETMLIAMEWVGTLFQRYILTISSIVAPILL